MTRQLFYAPLQGTHEYPDHGLGKKITFPEITIFTP
jgi:hypothetical protein